MSTQYSKMSLEEFIAYAQNYTIDACHPQIVDEAVSRLQSLTKEIEKLNKYLEVAQNRYKNLRLECADEYVDWLLSLFPKNEDTLILSRPTVLHWYGRQHSSFREYLDRALEGAFEQEREDKRNAKT